MSKSKKETTVAPWQPAQKYILGNLADTKATFDQNQPKLQAYATQQQDAYGRLAPGAEQGITSAQSLVNRNLSGANLTGNPYLQGIIDKTKRSVTDGVNSQFSAAGRYGSGQQAGILTRELANAENGLRYQDYSTERGYQQSAIGDAQNLMGGATGLLNNAAQLPWVGVTAQNGGTTSLSSPYSQRTEVSTPSLMDTIGGVAKTVGQVAGTAGMFMSDERIKDNIQPVGQRPDGLGIYSYEMGGQPQVGVLAQDVEQKRPDAVGPTMPDGTKTVNYAALGMPEGPQPVDYAGLQQNVGQIKAPKMGLFGTLRDDPSLSKPENSNRLFWSRVAAASGSPFGEAVLSGRNDALQQQNDTRRFGIQEKQADALASYRDAQAARQAAPPPPRIVQRRDGSVISVDPTTGMATTLSGPVSGPEPLVATENGYQPRSKAVGLNPYRAPPRASGGGGRGSKTPPKYTQAGGKILKWVP